MARQRMPPEQGVSGDLKTEVKMPEQSNNPCTHTTEPAHHLSDVFMRVWEVFFARDCRASHVCASEPNGPSRGLRTPKGERGAATPIKPTCEAYGRPGTHVGWPCRCVRTAGYSSSEKEEKWTCSSQMVTLAKTADSVATARGPRHPRN
jgi:hypothetical protein